MQRSRLLIALLPVMACTGGAAVRGDKHLPVRNVVLYRSGVGYFERAGQFSGEAVDFQVKQSEVGDFLASLTAVERGDGGVRSVSFEVPEPQRATHVPDEEPPPTPKDPRVEVKVAFDGTREHDLTVAYVVGAPIWRPSYRAVFDGSDKALLQAWAVVQNTSGEDWRAIKLALTTGAPISFRSDLGTPIKPERPLVSDHGEVVDYVPTGETVIEQRQAPPPPPAPAMMADEAERASEPSAGAAVSESVMKKELAKPAAPRRMAMPSPAISASAMARAATAQATASVLTESVTRYDLSQPVTIPNGSSTMVVIASQRVTGEQAHLYAPEPGVALSNQHPFAVARLHNDTGFVLERGPISVLANGAFLGQGVVDTLPREAQTFVPFSIDKSIVVEPNAEWSEQEGALVRVQHGMLTVRRFSQRKTLYHLRNGGAATSKVYVRHARWTQAELSAPPAGTELTPDKALVPVSVPAYGRAELALIERTPVELTLSLLDSRAADAVALWLSGPAASDPRSAPLKQALALRNELTKLDAQLAAQESEQETVNDGADQARENLKAIQKLASAKDLRTRLYERLKKLDARSGELTQQLIEGRTKRAELELRLNEALESLDFEAAPAKS